MLCFSKKSLFIFIFPNNYPFPITVLYIVTFPICFLSEDQFWSRKVDPKPNLQVNISISEWYFNLTARKLVIVKDFLAKIQTRNPWNIN